MMKRLTITYDYIFYTFFRFWEKAPSKWWSEWKSVLTISFFTILILFSFYSLILYHFNTDLLPKSKFSPMIIGVVVYVFNHYYFLSKNKWKKRIEKFQNMNKARDRIGILLIIVISIIIVYSLIYSIYLVSTVAKY